MHQNYIERLILVSNRLPITIAIDEKNISLEREDVAGGLATGLGSIYKQRNALWIGWSGIPREEIKGREEEIKSKLATENLYPVFLSQAEIKNYYYGFCNETLWPLFHYFPQYTIYDENLWSSYQRVNKIFCDELLSVAKSEDIIWIHDYHLMLLPKLIRERFPTATIGFFLHITFPSFEIFRLLPWRKEILEGLTKADLIGFHTFAYVKHFLDSVSSILGYEHSFNQIVTENRVLKVDCFPMGIKYEKFKNSIQDPKVKREVRKIKKRLGEKKIIFSIDRLDYTKGIIQRLKAFDIFLEKNPEYKKKISLIMVVVPSRIRIDHYRLLKKEVEELVGEINGKYSTLDWTPIYYFSRFIPSQNLAALYWVSDIALLTPLRDGMNLIAKEFLATKADQKGLLILSEMAGASAELGEALIVNPNDEKEIALAIKEALTVPEEEQKIKIMRMQKRIQRYNVDRWMGDFLDSLSKIKEIQHGFEIRLLTPEIRKKIINVYKANKERLFLLDYDGTLLPFFKEPEQAIPDKELLTLLSNLSKENEVVILSGRDKDSLEEWFGRIGINLVAEHGIWFKERDKDWKTPKSLSSDWKEKIKPVLELYVERTPGSFIEEKEFSLVWHYRKANPELAFLRSRELRDEILSLTSNLNLEILEGNKVIEVKSADINKGRAALHWIKKRRWDFILALGDDKTDEDIFYLLPPSAFSIKVGLDPSQAKFNLNSWVEVRSLLKGLK